MTTEQGTKSQETPGWVKASGTIPTEGATGGASGGGIFAEYDEENPPPSARDPSAQPYAVGPSRAPCSPPWPPWRTSFTTSSAP